ncbi:hypothetical protein [Deinococcus ruber]|uniref:DUF3887 domain-containing protein n=1 Tax=Deinococcus ruber TaxID=1848197 RepID=A0A918CPT1_9DEIO|nr:hypothetical protein [Deinococcus ruber]GGR34026.1 hypothetical protein GCM10008957_50280 [Deinococcus ruber]
MRKLFLLAALLVSSSAVGQNYKPAKFVDRGMPVLKVARMAGDVDFFEVAKNIDYQRDIPGPPTQKQFAKICQDAVKIYLKAPATAVFQKDSYLTVSYGLYTGTYSLVVSVDSQNSFGALLSTVFLCYGGYSGTAKSGTLLIHLLGS